MQHTLHELLAGVLLEESFVGDRTVEVVNHQAEDRVDLLLSVSCVVGQSGVPGSTLQDQAGKVHGRGTDLTLGVTHESVVKKADFHEVLAEGSGLDVVVVGLGDAAQEVHGVGVAHVVVEGLEDVTFGIQDLLVGKGFIGDMAEVGDMGR